MNREILESYRPLLEELCDGRRKLDEVYKKYKGMNLRFANPEFVEAVAIVVQAAIYLTDLHELLILMKSDDDQSFSAKCAARLAVLRILERNYNTSTTFGRLKAIADRVGIAVSDEQYRQVSKALKGDRMNVEGLSPIRHTAAHYSDDVVQFIASIESIDIPQLERYISSNCKWAGALASYATDLMLLWPDDRLVRVT